METPIENSMRIGTTVQNVKEMAEDDRD